MNFNQLGQQLSGLLGSLGKQQPQQQQSYQQQPYNPAQSQPPGFYSPQSTLPPGWIAQFNQQYQRNFYVDVATGRSQWEFPAFAPPPGPPPMSEFTPPPGPPPPLGNRTSAIQAQSAYSAPAPQPYQPQAFVSQPSQPPPSVSPVTNDNYASAPATIPTPSQTPVSVPTMDSKPQESNLASYYGLNNTPQLAPILQSPGQPNQRPLFIPANSQNQSHSGIPEISAVGTVDPTIAIALELKQHVPSLMKAPPQGSKREVVDAWREYLRTIQDAQTDHTRSIRDAQIQHDQTVKDAHYSQQQYQLSQTSGTISGLIHGGNFMGNAIQSQLSNQNSLKQRLDDAQIYYNQSVEHAHQRMNDSVERANRTYEDAIRRFATE